MIPLIGLIVSMYAICRLAALPLEMGVTEDKILGFSPMDRYWIAVSICAVGICVIGLLAVLLLFSGASVPMPSR